MNVTKVFNQYKIDHLTPGDIDILRGILRQVADVTSINHVEYRALAENLATKINNALVENGE